MAEKEDTLIILGDCIPKLKELYADYNNKITTTFLDPPFNQDKYYPNHNDKLPADEYWSWMREVCELVYDLTKMVTLFLIPWILFWISSK